MKTIPIVRGQIWYVVAKNTSPTGSEMWSNRPALIVSNDGTNLNADFVNIVYLTTQEKRRMPYHVTVNSNGKKAITLCEQIFAVDKSRLESFIGNITEEELRQVDDALAFSLGIATGMKSNDFFQKWVNYIDRYNIDLSGSPIDESKVEDSALYKTLCEQQSKTIESLNKIIIAQKAILRKQQKI